MFGIAILAAIFANSDVYTSSAIFIDHFKHAVLAGAAFSAIGIIAAVAVPRRPRAETMVERLRQAGYRLTLDDVLRESGGAYAIGTIPNWSWDFALDSLKHQILPALALILGSVGGWVLSMRGMGVTIQGEDYVTFAEHKGLGGVRIFRDYYLRNALLPQVTGFALALARGLGEYGSVIFIAGNMPGKTEIAPLLIVTRLEQYDYAGAAAIATVMLAASFVLLFAINALQRRLNSSRVGL